MEEDWDAETNNQPGVTFSLTTEQVLGWQQTLEDVEDCFNYKPEVYGSIINTKSSDNSITENVITSEEDEQQDTCTYKGKELNTHSRKIQYVPHKIFVGNIDFRVSTSNANIPTIYKQTFISNLLTMCKATVTHCLDPHIYAVVEVNNKNVHFSQFLVFSGGQPNESLCLLCLSVTCPVHCICQ